MTNTDEFQPVIQFALRQAVSDFGVALAGADQDDYWRINRLARRWRRIGRELRRRLDEENRALWPALSNGDAFGAGMLSGLVEIQVRIDECLTDIHKNVEYLTRLMDGGEDIRRDVASDLANLAEDLRYRQVLRSTESLPATVPARRRDRWFMEPYGLPVILSVLDPMDRVQLLNACSPWTRWLCRLTLIRAYEHLIHQTTLPADPSGTPGAAGKAVIGSPRSPLGSGRGSS